MKVVVTPPAFCKSENLKSKLSSIFPNTIYNEKGDYLSESELVQFLKDSDAAIIGRDPVTKTTLEALPKLKMISKYGIGLDNLDIPSINEKGVEFAVTAGTNKRSVAELTLSFMLGLCHRTFIGAERIKQGKWIREGGHDLSGKIVGIIGCGNVGKEVVHLLKPFGCMIMVCDIEDRSEFCCDQGITQSSFESLAEKSDIITLHVPLTDLTRDMIDEAVLRKMQRASYLINTSRGPVVNTSALYKALVSGEISGAALDVFYSEPPNDMEFLQLPNLMVTPHIGGNSVEAVEAMGQAAIDNLVAFLKK